MSVDEPRSMVHGSSLVELGRHVTAMDDRALAAYLGGLDPDELEVLEQAFAAAEAEAGAWRPLTHQVPPPGNWYLWLLLAGRGAGKTDACAHYLDSHVKGPACDERLPGGHRVSIIAPTLGDALDACVNGPSGLKAHNPDVRSVQTTGGTYVRWPNGAEGKLFGAETPRDVEALRAGGNRCRVWLEELAAWRHLEPSWNHMRFGLRVGPDPRAVASTTPKPRPLIRACEGRLGHQETKELLGDATVVVTRAATRDNPHLDQRVRASLYSTYEGSRLGRQELEGELLEDVEGALWRREWIQRGDPPRWGVVARTVVALDPAGGTGAGDEQAIVVACLTLDRTFYVLHSEGVRLSPDAWLRRAVALYDHFRADRVIYEKDYGDQFLTALLRTVAPDLPAKAVHARVGKRTRAEPISALYEQGKVTHSGPHDVLEDQLCSFSGAPGEPSPDRLDALVWALTELSQGAGAMAPVVGTPGAGLVSDDVVREWGL